MAADLTVDRSSAIEVLVSEQSLLEGISFMPFLLEFNSNSSII